MVKHIVMWNIQGGSDAGKAAAIDRVKAAFEALRGKIPGLLHIEIGVDRSGVDYACDVVLYSEFESQAALDAYAMHPEHLRVRQDIEGLRVARHQVDYAA
ncbi:Dabb family protein [Hydrogenophaga sp.]|uniref:Dabb family protein n=1 Tax=Hydrogenophaga sp. TaxID=1904254 RepID=UPI002732167E|nr:Dabb family protein [Hydrogenophaga sp.]MDP2073977.1 Dabb family protein [Hydrogenophaga sp.]MDP3107988.1 Dabb family protein [Hydrogenophaga sp.]MDP3349340.1 Dabb family protein [Hydrogenophaga sp.]MDZ4282678.1 Dabb family protein [Hydrogenophaga sp.]